MAERLLEWLRATTVTGLIVRFQIGPLPPEIVREQIERFGSEVVPLLRAGFPELLAGRARAEAAAD